MKFSWSASVLLAIVGGVAALSGQTRPTEQLTAVTHLSVGATQRNELREWDRLPSSGAVQRRLTSASSS